MQYFVDFAELKTKNFALLEQNIFTCPTTRKKELGCMCVCWLISLTYLVPSSKINLYINK